MKGHPLGLTGNSTIRNKLLNVILPSHLFFLSDLSSTMSTVGSPGRRFSVSTGGQLGGQPGSGDGGGGDGGSGGSGDMDFFSHLYSGDMTAMETGSVPEDYYAYLESWYRAQKVRSSRYMVRNQMC